MRPKKRGLDLDIVTRTMVRAYHAGWIEPAAPTRGTPAVLRRSAIERSGG
jgi:hypothetical protein